MSTEKITIRDIYNVTERNYDWEAFKYVNPRKYTSPTVVKGVTGGCFGNKNSYLDDLEKQKQTVPGPSYYKVQDIKSRPKSGKMDKKQRTTYSDQIKATCLKQNIPGPGAYFKRSNSAQTHNPLRPLKNDAKDHYLNQVQFLANTSPGVGQYNLTQLRHVATPSIVKRANKNRVMLKQEKLKHLDTMKCVEGTFDWQKQRSKKKNSNFFGTSKRFTEASKSKNIPGPTSYKLNTNWSNDTNLMKSTCTQLSLFSGNVYYR